MSTFPVTSVTLIAKIQNLAPGEVAISGGDSTIRLGAGALELDGHILINGQELEKYIRQIVTEILGSMG